MRIRPLLILILILILALAGGTAWYLVRATRSPQERADELRDKADALRTNEEYRKAIKLLRKCIELEDGGNSLSFSLLAICYRGLGELDEAKAQMENALRLDPSDGCMRVIYAGILLDMAPDEAAGWRAANAELDRLTPKARRSPYVAYNLATLYAAHDRPRLALQFLTYAVEKDPQNRSKAREDEDFENLRNLPEFQRLVQ